MVIDRQPADNLPQAQSWPDRLPLLGLKRVLSFLLPVCVLAQLFRQFTDLCGPLANQFMERMLVHFESLKYFVCADTVIVRTYVADNT